jgi:SAM-dependent methyltransferase
VAHGAVIPSVPIKEPIIMTIDQHTSPPPTTEPAAVDPDLLNEFLGRFVGDLGAAMHSPLIVIGDRLGIYKELAEGPATSAELADRTALTERYVREWLAANAAAGYLTYDPATERFAMTPEQVAALADESSPAFVPGAFRIALAVARDSDRIEAAFRTGEGVGWHEHDHNLFHGTERFFRPGYVGNLVSSWLPALDGVVAKLEAGARVADVGCGHGASTILMAEAYPSSPFVGFDYHDASIEAARKAAAAAGVADRVSFEVASASSYPGTDYDLVAVFDCLHDMGDPVGAAAHVRSSLADDGTWLIVEPYANDRLEDNLNPVGRVFYSASTSICTPASRSQEVGLALGAQAGEARLQAVLSQGGFTRVRRATETPFHLVLEARP